MWHIWEDSNVQRRFGRGNGRILIAELSGWSDSYSNVRAGIYYREREIWERTNGGDWFLFVLSLSVSSLLSCFSVPPLWLFPLRHNSSFSFSNLGFISCLGVRPLLSLSCLVVRWIIIAGSHPRRMTAIYACTNTQLLILFSVTLS